jgi:phosphatidylglycerophosphate synthase
VHKNVTDPARPDAIEDPSNLWFVHPLSWRLLPGALRLGIHPNTVSFAGMACGALAGLSYYHWRDPRFVLLGFALMVAWHVLDGLDGKLARASGKASPLGRLIDGLCDYLAFILVLVPLALSFENWPPVLALALASGAVHAMQSIWYEAERDAWKRRAAGQFNTAPRPLVAAIAAPYHWFENKVAGPRPIDHALAANPALLPAYLAASAPLVRQLSILSANNRTIAIALACLIGNPKLYWYWEIFALTALAFLMALRLRQREASLANRAAMVLDHP